MMRQNTTFSCRVINIMAAILLWSLTCSPLMGQSNFIPAYIVNNQGDTLQGWADYRVEKENGKACVFKVSDTSVRQTFLPGEITAYRFTKSGELYFSRTITINNVEQTVFLELLVRGSLNLYYYTDWKSGKEYFFFEDTTGKFTAVTQNPDRIGGGNESEAIYKDVRYKNVLAHLFRDRETVAAKAADVDFSTHSMIRITKEYNDLSGGAVSQLVRTPGHAGEGFRARLGAYGGMQWVGSAYREYTSVAYSPLAGVRVYLSDARVLKSFSVQADFYISWQSDIRKEWVWNWNLALTAKYTMPKGFVRPTAEAGIYWASFDARTWATIDWNSTTQYHGGFYGSVGANLMFSEQVFMFIALGGDISYNFSNSLYLPHLKVGLMF